MWYNDVMKGHAIDSNDEIHTFERGEDATIGTKVVLLHHVLVLHPVVDINVALNGSVITTGSRLMTYTCS